MVKLYTKNVNDLFDYNKSNTKVSLHDIYAQTYNISTAEAMKKANDYLYNKKERAEQN